MKPDLIYSLFRLFLIVYYSTCRGTVSKDSQMPLFLWEYDGWDIIVICFSKFIWINMERFESSEIS